MPLITNCFLPDVDSSVKCVLRGQKMFEKIVNTVLLFCRTQFIGAGTKTRVKNESKISEEWL